MIMAAPAVTTAKTVAAKVTSVIKADDLVSKLRSLFDPAMIIAPLLSLGNTSRSAVAPDFISIGGEGALALA